MWANEQTEGYEIANIPFYVMELACGDIVSAAVDATGVLRFDRLVRPNGHSTVRLLFARESDVSATRKELVALGCSSELSDTSGLVAVDVPPSVDYEMLRQFFDKGERAGTFEYEEACLGFR